MPLVFFPIEVSEENLAVLLAGSVAVTADPKRTRRTKEQMAADAAAAAAAAATSKPTQQDLIVYHPDGTVRASFAHSKDAADVLLHDVRALSDHDTILKFGEANKQTMAKLDKEDQDRFMAGVGAHVAEIKAKEAPATAAPTDDLKALFGGAPVPLGKDEFSRRMIAISRALGPVTAKEWLVGVLGHNEIDKIEMADYRRIVEDGEAYVAKVKAA